MDFFKNKLKKNICGICEEEVQVIKFTRMHQCRRCCLHVCSKCSLNKILVPSIANIAYPKSVRGTI